MTDNFINIPISRWNDHVCRFMPVHRLIEFFSTNQFTLTKPKLWDDPFENLFLKSPILTKTGRENRFLMREYIFGQCWTLERRELDAMWRIYTPNKDGVRIKASIRGLLRRLQKSCRKYPYTSCFIGKVKYLSQKKLITHFRQSRVIDGSSEKYAETLLVKRVAFKYEKEVRLIYLDKNMETEEDYARFQIDPEKLISEILFDPRMDNNLYKVYFDYLKRKRFPGKIKKSTLYDPPKRFPVELP